MRWLEIGLINIAAVLLTACQVAIGAYKCCFSLQLQL